MYKRMDHLKSHQASATHKAIFAGLGDRECAKQLELLNQAKQEHAEQHQSDRMLQHSTEANAWNSRNNDAILCRQPVSRTLQYSVENNQVTASVQASNDEKNEDPDDDFLLLTAAELYDCTSKFMCKHVFGQ